MRRNIREWRRKEGGKGGSGREWSDKRKTGKEEGCTVEPVEAEWDEGREERDVIRKTKDGREER